MTTLRKGSHGRMVKTLNHWLNALQRPQPPIKETTQFTAATESAVRAFKMRHGLTPVDGEVNDATWAAIGQALGTRAWLTQEMPLSLVRILQDVHVGPLNFRHDKFFEGYMLAFGGLDENAVTGLSKLLRFIDRDPDLRDVRWAAYMLATVKHECAGTWQPIEEYGKGAGHAYGQAVEVSDGAGHTSRHAYYGRGYVQLTWKKNYETMGQALHLGATLVAHPEKVLEPEIAYKIMSHGMRHGSFTGKKLADFVSGKTTDYVHARRIINGLDRADLIAGYATKLETILRGSLFAGARG